MSPDPTPAGAGSASPGGGLIVRQAEPANLETPFGGQGEFITRNEEFFVRCHFPIPAVTRHEWRLGIGGEVQHAGEWTWEELRALPETSVTATLECAGNGRVFLSPPADGVQWERGAVGNAVWTGVRLAEVLQRAGVKADAREVLLVGCDQGEIEDAPRPGGKIHFARSLPLRKALDDVILAWHMNGEELTPAHGFPVRAIVPGWYGMASVKWLRDITVLSQPFHGYFQTVDYAYWQRGPGEPSLVPISELQVKAQIARPSPAERVALGQPYLVRGAAWSGGAEITAVEVSTDGGTTWQQARLDAQRAPHAWRWWAFSWQPERPGPATLMVRATDALGRTQPKHRDRDRGGYVVNEVLGLDVTVG